MNTTRLAVVGILAATAIAVPVAALASGSSPTPGPKSSSTATPAAKSSSAAAKSSSAATDMSPLASSVHLSEARLRAGLVAAKRAGGKGAAAVAAFAHTTGASQATAQHVIDAVFGSQVGSAPSDADVARALAARLHVSTSAAGRAVRRLDALSSRAGGVDPNGAGFAAIAHALGVTPHQLAGALDGVKRAMAGK